MHDTRRTANLLGATALAVTDLVLAGATAAAGTSGSGAAALVLLRATPGLSVTELGRRVGLTQPAAARSLLEARGGRLAVLVEMLPPADREALTHALERLLAAIYGEVGNSQRV